MTVWLANLNVGIELQRECTKFDNQAENRNKKILKIEISHRHKSIKQNKIEQLKLRRVFHGILSI